jgi:hypothetical protein
MMACDRTFSLRSNPSGHITADKRGIKNFAQIPSATSFIRETLSEIIKVFYPATGGILFGAIFYFL